MIVTIGIITRGRNTLLKGCLESIACLNIPTGNVTIHFLLVDNNSNGEAKAQFDTVNFPFESTYLWEKQRGIVLARNRVLEECVKLDSDILGFIDDDEIAHPNWLKEGVKTMNQGFHVSTGPCRFDFERTVPKWIDKTEVFRFKEFPEGSFNKASSSRNVFIDLSFVRQNSLRFNPAFNDTGGSDTLFFKEAIRQGSRTYWNPRQIVTERIPSKRASLEWIVKRNMRLGGAKFKRWKQLHSNGKTTLKAFQTVLLTPFWFVFAIVTCWHPHWWVRGSEQSAKGFGMLLAIIGRPHAEYKNS